MKKKADPILKKQKQAIRWMIYARKRIEKYKDVIEGNTYCALSNSILSAHCDISVTIQRQAKAFL